MSQTAVEWLNKSNIVICEMLLSDKISETQYEQLINCFSINLEQAKQMEADQSKADCDVARMQGWNKGYEDGHDEGFSKGYEEAMYDSINK